MGMVTLIQQQQILDDNQYQKEQDHTNNIVPVDSHTDNFSGEIQHVARETAVAVPGNDNSIGSSTQCSDIEDEYEEEEETDIEEAGKWVTDPSVSTTIVQQHQAIATTNGDVVLPNADPANFGDVCVKNSTNVHLGNKTFYKGPVTIKQFVYTNSGQDTTECEINCVSDENLTKSTTKSDVNSNSSILPIELYKVRQWLWTWRCAALLCILALAVIALVISSIYLTRHADTSSPPIFPEIPDSSIEGVTTTSVRFVERNEWGAQPPSEPLKKLKLPVPYVIISHTATDFCSTQSDCTFHVRFAQTFHIESRKWADIGYNFLVGGDGLAYVGRSWDFIGAHSFGFNSKSIGISFIGTFNAVVPPKVQLHAAQKIIELGIEGGKISPDYKLLGHRQVSKTLSPGDALYSIIKKWPNWSPAP